MNELNEALKPFNQYDACGQCGKRTDGLMLCRYPYDDDVVKLCPDCIEDSGFCLMCGYFSAGLSSFDFSPIPGYCGDCVDEIRQNMSEMDEEYDDWCNKDHMRDIENTDTSTNNDFIDDLPF